MYYNHNLRTNLQEWKNRLYKGGYEQFPHQFKYFLSNIENNKQLAGLIAEAKALYPYSQQRLQELSDTKDHGGNWSFENEIDHASFCIDFIKYLLGELNGSYDIHAFQMFMGHDFNESRNNFIDELITPLVNYCHDRLEKSNSTIYLLEKYKRRTEWFTRTELFRRYKEANANYEQIFEDDLRMFLFDQGIDYPFSTPKSTSGRADIIGAIDTSDPIVVEIKIVDMTKGYGKNRIKEGFTQVLRYVSDYNKDIGYLVLFNVDNIEIDFAFSERNNVFPPMLSFNNKTFFFVVVNVYQSPSASKLGTLKSIQILESELFN